MAHSSWPTELRVSSDRRTLTVRFDNGDRFALPAEYLRVESPSAEVQGHRPSEKQVVEGKQNVAISAIEPIGNYAVRIVFDDGHDSGLYAWDYFRELGEEKDSRWLAYLIAHGRDE
jgi:DUF971 family protein